MNAGKGTALAAVALSLLLAYAGTAWGQSRSSSSQMGATSDQWEGAGLKGDALIQYDAETGSLIVVTDKETNDQIQKVVEDLDRPVPQVLIKVLFLEVTHSDDLDLGIEGFIRHDTLTPVQTETIQSIFGLASETTGGFFRIVEDDLDVTLRALSQVAKLEVLSRPSILTRNNRAATITVGQEVPFIRNSRVTQDGQTINTVEYEDIGIILEVTPHISEDGLVAMDVTPEISTLTGETVPISSNVNAPVFAKRSAETGVVVPDGSTVVIGGLMEDNKTNTTRKVPLLGDIPLLGAAFRRKVDSKTKTELLIFLTPHVVEGMSQLEEMTLSERSNAELAPKAFPKDMMDRYLAGPKNADNGDDNVIVPSEEPAEPVPPPAPPATRTGNKGKFRRGR